MKLLLDTHGVIWWLADDPNLTDKQRRAIQDRRNTCYVSAATVWEISIKQALGKLVIDSDYLDRLRSEGFVELPVSWKHSQAAQNLPPHHRDPFDRLLVAQARMEGMCLVSGDEIVRKYDLTVI
ncbi:MAG: type II toxin-antitoxin system VapC family toxin [Acidobacteria bacterium]|nr:type II toxin-antitoxin system VapC family toxin [Acidobacteriota bacterium]